MILADFFTIFLDHFKTSPKLLQLKMKISDFFNDQEKNHFLTVQAYLEDIVIF